MNNDTLTQQTKKVTPGIRISLRGEDFIVTNRERDIIDVEGISELVYGQSFKFDLRLEKNYKVIQPEETELKADTSTHYRQTKLFLETTSWIQCCNATNRISFLMLLSYIF